MTALPAPASGEEPLLALIERGDTEAATTAVLRTYGPEVMRLLATLHRGEDEASEVFSMFAEAVWTSLPRFEGRASLRTWAYAIARRASLRYRRDQGRRAARFVPFPEGSTLAGIEAHVRTETLSILRSERRAKIAALRDALPPEDRMLLVLRVDRQLEWTDLARVMSDDEGALTPERLKRESARLRKRFQLVKEKLRALGQQAGLLEGPGDTGAPDAGPAQKPHKG